MKTHRFVAIVALLGAAPLSAATFCVQDSAALDAAIFTAITNGESDEVRVVQGTYPIVGGTAFRYSGEAGFDFVMVGGWFAGCMHRSLDATLTVLDGNSQDRALDIFASSNLLHVEGFTLTNGVETGSGGGASVVGTGGSTTDIVVRGNIFHSNTSAQAGGALVGTADLGGLEVSNNLFHGNHDTWGNGAASLTFNGSGLALILNNTVADNTTQSGDFSATGGVRIGGSGDSLFANNISWGNENADFRLQSSGTMTFEFNDYGSIPSTQPTTETGRMNVHPGWSGSGDYDLPEASPIADGGTATPSAGTLPSHDILGRLRPQGTAIEPGAFEIDFTIFRDGFETGQTSAWAAASP